MRDVTGRDAKTAIISADDIAAGLEKNQQILLDQITKEVAAVLASIEDEDAAELVSEMGCSSRWSRANKGSAKNTAPTLTCVLRLRAHRALESVMKAMPSDALFEAAAAPRDLDALILAVSAGAIELPATQKDPMTGAMILAFDHRRQLLEQASPLLTAAEVQKILGVSRQAIDKRRERGSILGIRIGHNWAYPQLQFDLEGGGQVYPCLSKVLAIHKGDSAWVVLDSLLAADPAFGGMTLLQVVREGRVDLIDLYARQLMGDGFI